MKRQTEKDKRQSFELHRETLRALSKQEAGTVVGGITTTVMKSFCGVSQCYC
jgi:hypothetical protein